VVGKSALLNKLQSLECRTRRDKLIINDELLRIRKESISTYSEVICRHSPGKIEENHEESSWEFNIGR
jgi:hypothetical protein